MGMGEFARSKTTGGGQESDWCNVAQKKNSPTCRCLPEEICAWAYKNFFSSQICQKPTVLSMVTKTPSRSTGGGTPSGKRPLDDATTDAGTPGKKKKKKEGGPRRCITISWLYTKSHSSALPLRRLQYYDEGLLSDDGAALLTAVDPRKVLSQEFRTLVMYDRCITWFKLPEVKNLMDPPTTFMDRQPCSIHRLAPGLRRQFRP